ncbi:unnamed protein product [Arctogadus glacialis]
MEVFSGKIRTLEEEEVEQEGKCIVEIKEERAFGVSPFCGNETEACTWTETQGLDPSGPPRSLSVRVLCTGLPERRVLAGILPTGEEEACGDGRGRLGSQSYTHDDNRACGTS